MTQGLISSDNPLTDDERTTLRLFVGRVIPESSEYAIPGADDPDIFADILATAGRTHDLVSAGIATIIATARQAHGDDFAALVPSAQEEVVANLENNTTPHVRAIVSIAAQCYYRDDRVMESLGMEPRPPFPKGFEIDAGDWSLLDAVKSKGKIYREV